MISCYSFFNCQWNLLCDWNLTLWYNLLEIAVNQHISLKQTIKNIRRYLNEESIYDFKGWDINMVHHMFEYGSSFLFKFSIIFSSLVPYIWKKICQCHSFCWTHHNFTYISIPECLMALHIIKVNNMVIVFSSLKTFISLHFSSLKFQILVFIISQHKCHLTDFHNLEW